MSRIGETLRRKFWLLPAVGLAVGVGLAYGMTELDQEIDIDLGIFGFSDAASARNALSTLATATLSVAGIAFSVTLVALQLASSQLSPRVLTTFREDRITQITLAAFLGVFAYALVLLGRLGEAEQLPELSLSVAMLSALGALGLFVAFVGRTVAGLQASTVIARILHDSRRAVTTAHPRGFGTEPEDGQAARQAVEERRRAQRPQPLRARQAGYLVHIQGVELLAAAGRHDALVVQEAHLGDYVATGQAVASVYLSGPASREAIDALQRAFQQSDERTMSADVAFPVRSLADIALRALSPSLNDPTTAENAMGALSDIVLVWLDEPRPDPIRCDGDQVPRLLARPQTLGDLVQLGYEQVRREVAKEHPELARRLITWLEQIARRAEADGVDATTAHAQIDLLRRGCE